MNESFFFPKILASEEKATKVDVEETLYFFLVKQLSSTLGIFV